MTKKSKTTYEFGVVEIPTVSGRKLFVEFSTNTWTVLARQETLGM
jgi:hypothetical protein